MSDVVIRVEELGKRYHIGQLQKYKALRDTLTDALYAPFRVTASILKGQRPANAGQQANKFIWALRGISLEVKQGQVIGIIGRNGAGKSTLLKILSRITDPTEGYARIHGRLGSLLEVGTGFHPELTGRENIYLNGAILGMKKREIDRKLDEIVAFAGVERFIDTPVKHFSSGMFVRLAFAVAAHLEPEILVVDEVLAVGDADFQRKCLGKMEDVAKSGRTVLFVTHNMSAITRLCNQALWLDGGRLRATGSASQLVTSYLLLGTPIQSTWIRPSSSPPNSVAEVKSVRILTEDNTPTAIIEFDSSFKVEIVHEILHPTRNLILLLRLIDSYGNIVWTSWDTDSTVSNGHVRGHGLYQSKCIVPSRILRPGRYFLSVGVHIANMTLIEYHANMLAFDISQSGYPLNIDRTGLITPILEWEVKRINTLVRSY